MSASKSEVKKRYWNNQKWCECQLVTLWNAAIYHDIDVPIRYGKEYKKDCHDGCAINGGCIDKSHVLSKLKLKPIKGKLTWQWCSKHLPCEFSVFCHRGFHSVLSVEVDKKRKRIAVTNLDRDRITWLQWRDLKVLVPVHNGHHNKPIKWGKL